MEVRPHENPTAQMTPRPTKSKHQRVLPRELTANPALAAHATPIQANGAVVMFIVIPDEE
jgi:hypothetical protein